MRGRGIALVITVGSLGLAGSSGIFAKEAPAAVWCTHSTVKIRKDTPAGDRKEVRLALARNEWESAQIVVRPDRPLKGVSFRLPEVEGLELSLRKVEYVAVRRKTDDEGEVGDWPDPLAPIEGPMDLDPGRNHVFWLTVRASESAVDKAFEIDAGPLGKIPVRVTVWKFALPKSLRTRTAYRCAMDFVGRWHGLVDPEQKRRQQDLYFQAFRDHRISPYHPFVYHEPVLKDGTLDFAEFDKAGRRYLEEFGFNSFVLDYKGARELPPELDGHKPFTPGYCERLKRLYAPLLDHLRDKGWLDRALVYWADEPHPSQAARIQEGMRRVVECLPGVKRVLPVCHEKTPAEKYHGLVDVWCPLMSQIDFRSIAERRKKGEEVWCYVCTIPRGRYPTDFVDRPAVDHRIRYWLMSSLDLQGDLYWEVCNWRDVNPWQDPMGYMDGQALGNGDGILFYPPVRGKDPPKDPVVAAPIPSIRLAMIRDGLEDLEYLRLLKDRGAAELLKKAHALAPSQDQFERDPERLLALREQIGEFLGR